MKFILDKLSHLSLDQLQKNFLSIPKTETVVELVGPFNHSSLFVSNLVKSVPYLPKHINHVFFIDEYQYSNYPCKVEVGTTWRLGKGSVPIYETRTGYIRSLSGDLQKLVPSLPKSVQKVSFFIIDSNPLCTKSTTSDDFSNLFKKLSNYVSHLDMGPTVLKVDDDKLIQVLETLPNTLLSLNFESLKLGQKPTELHYAIVSTLKQSLRELNLANNELALLNNQQLCSLFQKLSPNIHWLSISQNNLNQKSAEELWLFFTTISANILFLALAGNHLSTFNAYELEFILSGLSKTLMGVDLSDNGLLFLENEAFSIALLGLPPTVKIIRLCEKKTCSFEILSQKLSLLPETIDTWSVSDSNLLGLFLSDFIELLPYTPSNVHTLDMSGNFLSDKISFDFTQAFSKVPPHIKKIKFNRNNLSCLETALLKQVLSSLPRTVLEIDFSENGFDSLGYSELTEKMHAMSYTSARIILDKQFGLRNDGALVPCHTFHQGFKSQASFKHRRVFADLYLVMRQIIEQDILSRDIVLLILSFLLKPSQDELQDMAFLLKKSVFTQKTFSLVQKTMEEVERRIEDTPYDSTKLDLSRCGLHCLDQADFKQLFSKISPSVTDLILRGNGFQYNTAYIFAFNEIPLHVSYLDLSAHGFENESADSLEALFSHLPPHVKWVSLSHEKPLSPREHIAKRRWPESYMKLVANIPSTLQKARNLLNDYIKGDSATKRFFSGHWNRHNTKEAAKIIKEIDEGYIVNISDLFFKFAQLNMPFDAGSLGKRLEFLLCQDAIDGFMKDFRIVTIDGHVCEAEEPKIPSNHFS